MILQFFEYAFYLVYLVEKDPFFYLIADQPTSDFGNLAMVCSRFTTWLKLFAM